MLPLEKYRIVELGLGPVPGLAGMILADFGAEVIKASPPDGDPFEHLPSSHLWLRGKKQVEVNLKDPTQRAAIKHLVLDTADALISSLNPNQRSKYGFDIAELQGERTDLVIGSVSGFGERGPYASYPGYEGLVAAKSGRMLNFAGVADREGPNYCALQVGIHATSQSLAAGTLAALDCRERTGIGLTFTTSLLRGMMPYEMGVISLAQLQEKGLVPRPQRARDRTKSMPTLNYHPVQTKDGKWLQLGNLLPHLLDNYLRASGFEDIFEDENYQGDPFTWDRELLETFRSRMLLHMQTRTLDEWMDHYVADGGVVAHPYQTTQDSLSDPDVVQNGHVAEIDGEIHLGLLANLTETPGKVGSKPQKVDLDSLTTRKLKKPTSVSSHVIKPLEGITVIESATIIAAPLGAATLADMGARVIKLEPIAGDPFRNMMSSLGASKCNTGKESICLDLKNSDGRDIAQSLARQADIWIHNYRVGVPERLGIGYDQLSEVNPRLIYISANGYGPNGPGAKRPSTHPIPGAALGGVVWQIGGLTDDAPSQDLDQLRETARKLLRANEVNPDPNTSMVVATTAVLGLCARRASGKGQKIYIDMFGANAYANWDDFISYPGKPDRPPVDEMGYGLNPLYRLYECHSGWVFLGVISNDEKQRLHDFFEIDISTDRVEDILSDRFKQKPANEWEEVLTSRGIGCVVADEKNPPEFFMQDDHVKAENLLVPAVHPEWGEYLRLGPMNEFDSNATYPGTAAAGGATRSLLTELGYSQGQIDRLEESRVVRAA